MVPKDRAAGMTTRPLIDYFEAHLPLDEAERAAVEACYTERRVKRRHHLLREGEVCRHSTFVVEGCFRTYVVDPKGKVHNLQFAVENWWVGDIASFYSERPGKLYVQALEDSLVLQCRKEDQINVLGQFPTFDRIFRKLAENAMVGLQHRVLQNISSTAEERYLDFVERHPHLLNRISNVQIASFIGVTPEFLSTIRKKLVRP